MISKKALITRPYDDAILTSEKLQKLGYQTFIEPLLEINNLVNAKENFLKIFSNQTVVTTSINSIRFLHKINIDKNVNIVTVGVESAKQANLLGFKNVISAGGNLDKLVELITNNYQISDKFIYPCGTRLSGDLQKIVNEKGYKIEQIPVYEAIAVSDFSESMKKNIINSEIDLAFFYSKFTAKTFIKLVRQNKLEFYAKDINILCVSQKVTEEFLNQQIYEKVSVF